MSNPIEQIYLVMWIAVGVWMAWTRQPMSNDALGNLTTRVRRKFDVSQPDIVWRDAATQARRQWTELLDLAPWKD